ncbi:OsmC family protein [Acidisphaera sp. S103]|uniref:OsmC family protein n=1 Tax=Acidisphaera sp. S103 TaxID=1747223 RepID=UPI00131C8977|nr:OsmC family protein [Acidisphaera sp. S103]
MAAADPRVIARTTGQPGRFLVSARNVHTVGDATAARGGTGEAFVAAEFMLSALATCGLAIVTDEARKLGDKVTATTIDTTYTVDPQDSTRFSRVAMQFRFAGIGQAEADALVHAFTSRCPIYNTIARTTPTEVWGETA